MTHVFILVVPAFGENDRIFVFGLVFSSNFELLLGNFEGKFSFQRKGVVVLSSNSKNYF